MLSASPLSHYAGLSPKEKQSSFLSDESFYTAGSRSYQSNRSSSFTSTSTITTSQPTSSKKSPVFKLNLNYTRKPPSELAVHKNASDSSIEDFSLYDYVPTRAHKQDLLAMFNKFIPITRSLQFDVPRIQHNELAPSEWEECQSALLVNRTWSDLLGRSSKSDTEMITKQSKNLHKKKSKLKRFLHKSRKLFAIKTKSAVINETALVEFQPEDVEFPKLTDSRLSEIVNADYVEMNNKVTPAFSAQLYVQQAPGDNLVLCHFMTELAVSAMLNFFYPYSDVQCIWIANLQNKVREEIGKPFVHAKFTKLVYLGRFEALLVLSHDAGSLIRHRNLCFLQSLAASLNISPHKLLILQNDNL